MHEFPIDYYVDRLKRNDFYSFAGYSDAEWFSLLGIRLGQETGLGQILDGKTGNRLADVLHRKQYDPRFLFAAPKCLWEEEIYVNMGLGRWITNYLDTHRIRIEFYERDMVTDHLAERAGLKPFIEQLQAMPVCVIGNAALRGLDFLGYQHFVEISSPNLHLEEGGIERAVASAITCGVRGVYLVSAGMSAALIIDQLHDAIPKSFFLDCGSIWDAFVGIGGQREWRAKLYSNPKRLKEWKRRNLP